MDPKGVLPRDPRDLDLASRRAWSQRLSFAQREWHPRLAALAEGKLADDFPAFLLATTAFQSLADKIAACPSRSTTPTETLDELERFLDAFADYLRTDRDEAVFDQNTRRAG